MRVKEVITMTLEVDGGPHFNDGKLLTIVGEHREQNLTFRGLSEGKGGSVTFTDRDHEPYGSVFVAPAMEVVVRDYIQQQYKIKGS